MGLVVIIHRFVASPHGMRSGNVWTFQANIHQNQILLKNIHAFQVESVTSLKFCLAISKHNQERTNDIKQMKLFCCKQQIYCCNQRFQTVFFNICSYTYARSIAKIQQLWCVRILLNYNSIERKYLPDDCLQRSLCLMHDQLVIVQL